MALLLNESMIAQFLLHEAEGEEKEEPTGDDAEKDKGDVSADAKDTGKDSDDTSSEGEETGAAQEESEDNDSDEEEESKAEKPKRKPSRFAIEVEDTSENRIYLMDQFEQISKIHQDLLRFLDNVERRVGSLDASQRKAISFLRAKIESSVASTEDAKRDQIFINMDVNDLFGMLRIMIQDARHMNTLTKSVVSGLLDRKKGKK